MLTENDVVDAVVVYLRESGWCIERTSNTKQRGHDILARKGEIWLAVEAKGETSSKSGTGRYGQPFSSNQVIRHIAGALYKVAVVYGEGQYQPGIALPVTCRHQKYLEKIGPALEVLDVTVFLVEKDRAVRKWPHPTGNSYA